MTVIDEIAAELRKNGSTQARVADDGAAAEWRSAARAAARSLGRKVTTFRTGNLVVAALRDWPANELERQLLDARMRNAMERITAEPPTTSDEDGPSPR